MAFPSPDQLTLLTALGAAVAAYFVLNLISAFYKTFLRGGKNLRRFGQWAVVTGATDGIGKAYALELARKGLNVLLISRTQSRLNTTAEEIKTKYKVETRTLAIDFSNFDAAARAKVEAAVAGLDVGVLINNVGMSYPHPSYFLELSDVDVDSLLALNVVSTTWMTRIVLKGMEERRKGAIVNISSGAGHFPSPLLAEYSGVKSYVEMFSRALSLECAPKGIHVQCQAPMLVTTKLSKISKASSSIPSAEDYARVGARAIGYEDWTSPFWAHALQLWFIGIAPSGLVNKVVGNMHKGLRSRALKKKQANGKGE